MISSKEKVNCQFKFIIFMKKNYFFNLKGFSKICLLSVGLLFSASVLSTDITTGLKFNYDFEAVNGTTVPDVTGNGNDGTLQGGATIVAGHSGQGVLFGTTKADYMRLPANITVGIKSFTYAAWVNFSALKNATRFFDFGNGADATNNFLAFIPSYNSDNAYICMRYRPASGTAYNVVSTVKCSVGAWTHVAVTYDWSDVTSTGTATIYVNGAAAGSVTGLTYNLDAMGTTADNYIGYSRWAQDTNGFNGTLDDIRFYDRALSSDDILVLNGIPSDLIAAYNGLSIAGNLNNVTSNLSLPTAVGTTVAVSWSSSLPLVVTTDGNVTRPQQYDVTVKLSATLTETVDGVTHTLVKVFTVVVKSFNVTADQLAEWNFAGNLISESNGTFTVKDKQSGFIGTIMNEARIRTIGTSTQYNVLDLGNGTGYFDMGTEIGKAIYSLNNYSMCGYFRIDADYAYLNSNGNFYWTFSNTADAMTNQTGYIIGSLKAQSQSISSNYYALGNQAVGPGTNAPVGGWHHFAYTQKGTTGTIFVDGVQVSTGVVTNLPSTTLTKDGFTGTLYNWLGRSNYVSDVYLRKTLLWDFQLLSIPLTADDLNFGFEVPANIDKLNVAYGENPDYILPELTVEQGKLDLGDLSAVTSNITLPTQASDATVSISWKSSNPNLIDANGVVTRPNYYSYPDTLTATLSKNGQKVFKVFPAVVVVKDGTQYTNNLLVKYDFSSVADSVVTDVAEKHLTGILKNNASIRSIGSTVKYNVLSLGDSIGYFDMGTEVGKLMYNLNDFTVSAYVRIDSSYTKLGSNGNFLWNFSNTKNALNDPTGYLILSLRNQAATISPTNWSTEQTIAVADSAFKASWHNFTYTQKGNTGTIYVDGMPIKSDTITSLPSNTLKKASQLGTLYNWIGRSCYAGDVYLRKSLVYDFRLYGTALTDEQIQSSVLNVGATINALDAAYGETPNALKSVLNTSFTVIPTVGAIKITGLTGSEKVSLYYFTGRQLKVNNPALIPANTGIYIVKIDNYATKVIVR